MLQSMTGYGNASVQGDGATITVEIRTGNHRFLDLHIRLAREYGFLESEIAQLVREELRRGRVDVSVTVVSVVSPECLLNLPTARSYLGAAARLREELHLEDAIDLKTLLALPGVLQGQGMTSSAADAGASDLRKLVLECARGAMAAVLQMRSQEGKALEAEMRRYLAGIAGNVAALQAFLPEVLVEYRQKLQERLRNILPQVAVDPQRLAQELALLAEKSDVSEEIARLESHIAQYGAMLDDGREAGKKLEFLLQEMHREINTVLSKTGHVRVTGLGLAIKADIEKLREQVQNVE
jgi:uncharacterized protein (TIGR00255 family)